MTWLGVFQPCLRFALIHVFSNVQKGQIHIFRILSKSLMIQSHVMYGVGVAQKFCGRIRIRFAGQSHDEGIYELTRIGMAGCVFHVLLGGVRHGKSIHKLSQRTDTWIVDQLEICSMFLASHNRYFFVDPTKDSTRKESHEDPSGSATTTTCSNGDINR
jgi:hypothetical protein